MKTEYYFIIADEGGYYLPTLSYYQKQAIEEMEKLYEEPWKDLKKKGCKVEKVCLVPYKKEEIKNENGEKMNLQDQMDKVVESNKWICPHCKHEDSCFDKIENIMSGDINTNTSSIHSEIWQCWNCGKLFIARYKLDKIIKLIEAG